MQLPDELLPEAHRAIVECLKICAARSRAIRFAREARERENKITSAETLGSNAADAANDAIDTNTPSEEVCTDATK